MLQLVYCDTNEQNIKAIEAFLESYDREGLSVRGFGRLGEFMNYMDHYGESVDIAMVNISLGSMSGIRIMKLVQERLPEIQVIFLSNCKDMVFDVYDVRHVSYIPFPINRQRLVNALDMAASYAVGSRKKYLTLASKGLISRIDLEDILYIESNLRNFTVHTQDRLSTFTGKIEALKGILDQRFVQCHKSFLVNMTYIIELSSESAMLTNGESVPVSTRKYKETKEAFMNYAADSYFDHYM